MQLRNFIHEKTHALLVADEDNEYVKNHPGRRFSAGTRPVIRWIKGDGLDDTINNCI